jgi:DNA-binding CsgD family transcriptional regulator
MVATAGPSVRAYTAVDALANLGCSAVATQGSDCPAGPWAHAAAAVTSETIIVCGKKCRTVALGETSEEVCSRAGSENLSTLQLDPCCRNEENEEEASPRPESLFQMTLEGGEMVCTRNERVLPVTVKLESGHWSSQGVLVASTWTVAHHADVVSVTLTAVFAVRQSVGPTENFPGAETRRDPRTGGHVDSGPEQRGHPEESRAQIRPAALVPPSAGVLAAIPEPCPVKNDVLARLSNRERELLLLLAKGLTDMQIAQKLFISVRTVRSHLDRIRDKTGCRRRAELTRLAYGQRWP